ncbi:hypothetical protein RchiOBHm_Chr3g0478701 [Rosa chinensis]|uniref:Uncharacterized protein n=1 Tax=Rosa chinensis TaxID=74649 RepID=A0A2P6RD74_ROSCH|nr:hypothetical protein RchiOBHm_Chr3g0478701 [Rosa chinensis]
MLGNLGLQVEYLIQPIPNLGQPEFNSRRMFCNVVHAGSHHVRRCKDAGGYSKQMDRRNFHPSDGILNWVSVSGHKISVSGHKISVSCFLDWVSVSGHNISVSGQIPVSVYQIFISGNIPVSEHQIPVSGHIPVSVHHIPVSVHQIVVSDQIPVFHCLLFEFLSFPALM